MAIASALIPQTNKELIVYAENYTPNEYLIPAGQILGWVYQPEIRSTRRIDLTGTAQTDLSDSLKPTSKINELSVSPAIRKSCNNDVVQVDSMDKHEMNPTPEDVGLDKPRERLTLSRESGWRNSEETQGSDRQYDSNPEVGKGGL